MRPDQHKKKKSAQYQKKHGSKGGKTSDKSTGSDHGPDKKSGRRPGTEGCQVSSSTTNKQTAGATGLPPLGRGAPVRSEDGTQESDRNFCRRQVMSNWERYSGLSDEEEAGEKSGLRGADFQDLLGTASDAIAQFRFRDEQAWGDDESEDVSPQQLDYLMLDFADLAKSLQCVPLHTRLNIEEKAFGDKLVNHFRQEAEDQQLTYQPKVKVRSKHNQPKKCETADPIQTQIQGNDLPGVQEAMKGTMDNISCNRLISSNNGSLIPENTGQCIANNLDNDPVTLNDTPLKENEANAIAHSDKLSEDVTPGIQGSDKPGVASNGGTSATSELEDWLDSVLDD